MGKVDENRCQIDFNRTRTHAHTANSWYANAYEVYKYTAYKRAQIIIIIGNKFGECGRQCD